MDKIEIKYEAAKRGLTLKDVANGIGQEYNIFNQRLNGFKKKTFHWDNDIKEFFENYANSLH